MNKVLLAYSLPETFKPIEAGWLIETASIPKMLILFLCFSAIIAIMYLLYKTAKKGIEENNEKIEKIKSWIFGIMIILSLGVALPYHLFSFIKNDNLIEVLSISFLILKPLLIILLCIKPLNSKIKTVAKIVLFLLVSNCVWALADGFVLHSLWWEYPSHMIYSDTATMLANLFFLFITIFLLSKTKKSLILMKVIMILSVALLLSNVVFYFGYEIFNKVSERVLI